MVAKTTRVLLAAITLANSVLLLGTARPAASQNYDDTVKYCYCDPAGGGGCAAYLYPQCLFGWECAHLCKPT